MLKGLYAITDATLISPDNFSAAIRAVIAGGAAIIQYRDKSNDLVLRRQQASRLIEICREHSVLCLINDDCALAAELGADGVHIGRDDAELQQARSLLGPQAIIGVSCYNDLNAAQRAQALGANYVAFGRFFSSPTKPDAAPATLEVLRQARQSLHIPICAIGGITPENAPPLIKAGADMLAVISGVFGTNDIQRAARRYRNIFI